ncbi:MAG: TonB-dependent receptor plug domain-containing protein, partial [Opitutaceae bacterium]
MTSRYQLTKPARRFSLATTSALLAVVTSFAQSVTPRVDPAALAKYDTNKNGVLDASEVAAMDADRAKAAQAVETKPGAKSEDVVQLSPFEVNSSNDRGYAASNTLSGTRLNSSLEDIAGSISAVTKQQLIDTAALDINDIFLFEVGTEGTGQFTDMSNDGRGEGVWDNVSGNPTGANRIRGLAAANIAVGGFGASGTIPIDTYNVDAVEISRGSNSTLAGLGETGGTVNLVTSRGNLTRETTQFVGRFDSYGGYRASMDINRPLIKDKLAVRFSAVYNETGYIRKPSVDRTDRQQIAFTYRPFKKTTITASYERFHEWANRANSITPRDSVSLWRSRGSPTFDLNTLTYTVNGVRSPATFSTNGSVILPSGLAGVGGFASTRVVEFIDAGAIQLITRSNNPANTTLGLTTNKSLVTISNEASGGALYKVSGTTNKEVYDWESVNMAASSYQIQSAKIFTGNLDQSVFNTPRNRLDLQLAWRREDQSDYRRQFVGQLDGIGTTLQIDPNESLPDGRPNPFFLRPFIGGVNPQVFRKPVFNDNYRAQLAYQLDLRREQNALKWLGMHRAIGYGEYKFSVGAPQNLRYHDVVINPNFNPATTSTGAVRSQYANNDSLMYALFYMGAQGDFGLKYANEGPVAYTGLFKASYVNGTSTTYNTGEPVEIRELYFALGTQKKKVRTTGGSIQSFFFHDQVVTTIGR